MPKKKKYSRHRHVSYVGSAEAIAKRDKREAEYKQRRAADRARNIKKYGGASESEGSESESSEDELSSAQMAALRRGMKGASIGASASAAEPEERVFKPKNINDRLGLETGNLNAGKKTHIKIGDMKSAPVELSRREREELAKQKSHADYMRRHANLETVEAKKDMQRLKLIREQRAKAQKRRLQKEAAEEERAARAAAMAEEAEAPKTFKKLSNREIKAMKPPKLKEELKARGASTQGNKKQLIKRLMELNK